VAGPATVRVDDDCSIIVRLRRRRQGIGFQRRRQAPRLHEKSSRRRPVLSRKSLCQALRRLAPSHNRRLARSQSRGQFEATLGAFLPCHAIQPAMAERQARIQPSAPQITLSFVWETHVHGAEWPSIRLSPQVQKVRRALSRPRQIIRNLLPAPSSRSSPALRTTPRLI
jgi:hypothetical protein